MHAYRIVLFVALAALLVGGSHARGAAASSSLLTGRIVVHTSALARPADGTQLGPALSLLLDVDGALVSANLEPDVVVVSRDGRPRATSALHPGDWVQVEGVWEAATRFRVSRVVLLSVEHSIPLVHGPGGDGAVTRRQLAS